jgi:hypothetical protein
MGWRKNDPNLTNDPTYLEPRIVQLESQQANTSRQTQTLVHGPYNVLNGVVGAPVNIQIEGRTLIPMQNNVLDATKFYVLADKRTWLKWADASYTKGVAKFSGKAEKPTLVVVANYGDKVAGNTLENPHKANRINTDTFTDFITPGGGNQEELTQTQYNNIAKLDGSTFSTSRTGAGVKAQVVFSKDIIQEIERRFGRIPRVTLADKVQWAKDNIDTTVGTFKFTWNGYGSGPGGNYAEIMALNGANNTWVTGVNRSTTAETVTALSWNVSASNIDANGLVHLIAFTNASDGVTPSVINTDNIDLQITLKPNAVLHDPRVPLYEVTQTSYDAILNTWTEDEVIRRYPSVAGPTSLQNPYLMAEGDNLFPSFYEVIANTNSSSSFKFNNTYELEVNPTVVTATYDVYFKVNPNTTYSFSVENNDPNARIVIRKSDGTKDYRSSASYTSGTQITFTTDATTTEIYIRFFNGTPGQFIWKNPMFNIGNPKPFVPRNPSSLLFETKLGMVGTVPDKLFEENGKYYKRKNIEEVVLDGSFPWTNSTNTTHANAKRFEISNSAFLAKDYEVNAFLTKYDGSLNKPMTSAATASVSAGNSFWFFSSGIRVIVFNSDTGFGDTYNPIDNEIKAFFNGWQAKTVDVNGKPTSWKSLGDGTDAPTQTQDYVKANKAPNYTPPKLSFVLAAPSTEEVKHEGSISVNGLTQADVGGGVIFREKAAATMVSGVYYINSTTANSGASKLKNKTNKILGIFKNGQLDKLWTIDGVNAYGSLKAQMSQALFDPSAEYTITYTLLPADQVTFTSNPVNITAVYANNIRTALDDTTKKTEDNSTEISVIKNNYAKKSKMPWISPTLLNAWLNFGGTYANVGYVKDDLGYVHLRGLIKSGTLAQPAFILPAGFRPEKDILIATTSNGAFGQLSIRTDGQVFIESGSNVNFSLENIVFRVEG